MSGKIVINITKTYYYDEKNRRRVDVSSFRTGVSLPDTKPEQNKEIKKEGREFLKPRSQVDQELLKGNKIVTLEKDAKKVQSAFYCNLCECSFPDNSSYLSHINGKNRNLKLIRQCEKRNESPSKEGFCRYCQRSTNEQKATKTRNKSQANRR